MKKNKALQPTQPSQPSQPPQPAIPQLSGNRYGKFGWGKKIIASILGLIVVLVWDNSAYGAALSANLFRYFVDSSKVKEYRVNIKAAADTTTPNHIYSGAAVCRDTTNNAIPCNTSTTSVGNIFMGIARDEYNNTVTSAVTTYPVRVWCDTEVDMPCPSLSGAKTGTLAYWLNDQDLTNVSTGVEPCAGMLTWIWSATSVRIWLCHGCS
jgi:hypothetical protein